MLPLVPPPFNLLILPATCVASTYRKSKRLLQFLYSPIYPAQLLFSFLVTH